MLSSRGLRFIRKKTNDLTFVCFLRQAAAGFPLCQLVRPRIPNSLAESALGHSFHSSSVLDFPERRRRRGAASAGDDNEENSPEDSEVMGIRHTAVTDPEIFAKESRKLMDKIFNALSPLKSSNDDFILTRGHEEDIGDFIMLDLGPVHGQYNIQVDLEEKAVIMQSPISGQILYILSASTGEWCGEVDGHRLDGLLVRDLIRQINGVPKF